MLLQFSWTVKLGMDFTADKAELSSMIVVPLNGGKSWSVFDHSTSITGGVRGFYGVIERDGRWFGYFGGITLGARSAASPGEHFLDSTRPELYEVELKTGKASRIARRVGDDVDRDWVVGADGKVAATLDFTPSSGNWKIGNGSGKIIASGQNSRGRIGLISLGRTAGSILYYVEDEMTGANHWFEVPGGGGDPIEILKEEVRSEYIDSTADS